MNIGDYWFNDIQQFQRLGVNLYDVLGNFRSLFDILQDISPMWDNAISAPDFTKSVFDLDNDDIDDEVELATDEEFKILLGVD